MKFPFSLPQITKISPTRKKRSRALTLSLLVGISTFFLATLGGRLSMGNVTSVVTAARDLQPGQVITAADLKEEGKITGILPTNVITTKDEIIGQSLSYPVKTDQPIIKGLIAETPMRNGLYPGEVGVWVPVSLTTSGLVKPGDIVSVYLTPDRNGGNWGQTIQSEMISSLEGVRVVSVINNAGQPIQQNLNNASGSVNANVPVAVQLAIPKGSAGAFSQLATGKVSLMFDPFATPATHLDGIQGPPNTMAPPSVEIQTPPNTNTEQSYDPSTMNPEYIQSPPRTEPNPDSQTVPDQSPGTGPGALETYNPPIFNPVAE
ncbi:Flp pilus assembly protein CpaB [Desulfitobacterium hafniense]|uniref:Flp pilus assembly protein CpaB n=1 Tax=Desulfitobacterium hafniense TaxID=49338 RepID=UPI0003A76D79|nr:SAF domain-containing protein [Desulfitobacterium hafniense]